MSLVPVASSNLQAIGYDPATKALTVQFKNGGAHRYEGVEADTHAALMNAESVGKFFHSNIRGVYASGPVELEAPATE